MGAISTLAWASKDRSIFYGTDSRWLSIIGLMQFFTRLHIGRRDGQEREILLTVIIRQLLRSWSSELGCNVLLDDFRYAFMDCKEFSYPFTDFTTLDASFLCRTSSACLFDT